MVDRYSYTTLCGGGIIERQDGELIYYSEYESLKTVAQKMAEAIKESCENCECRYDGDCYDNCRIGKALAEWERVIGGKE